MNQSLSKAQKEVKEYLETHKIVNILSDLLNSLGHTKAEKPIIFMIKFLANLVSAEDLKDNGIVIPGPYPNFNIAVPYPQFDKKSKNMFKNVLKPEIFMSVKNFRTSKYVSLREILDIALENENHPIGILAPDEDTYTTFSPIFYPILQELNLSADLALSTITSATTSTAMPIIQPIIDYGVRPDRLLKTEQILRSSENNFIKFVRIKVKRNLKGHAFNTIMMGNERAEVNNKIHIASLRLEEKFHEYHDLAKINQDIKNILTKDFGFGKYVNAIQKSCLKFKDWPASRSIYISQDGTTCLFCNKEDHLEIRYINKDQVDFRKLYLNVLNLIHNLEHELKFSHNSRLGYISSNPKYVGLGMRIKIHLVVPSDLIPIFKNNVALMNSEKSMVEIKELDPIHGLWQLKSTKSMGFNEIELVTEIEKKIHYLLQGVVAVDNFLPSEKNERVEDKNKSRKGYSLESLINSEAIIDETGHSGLKDDIFSLRKGLSFNDKEEGSLMNNPNSTLLYPRIIKGDFDIITQSYVIIRRNIAGFPFKMALKNADVEAIGKITSEFIASLPPIYTGRELNKLDIDYDEMIESIIKEYDLEQDAERDKQLKNSTTKLSQWPLGSNLFKSFNEKLIVLTNFEDHIILIFKLDSATLIDSIIELNHIISLLEKKAASFVYHAEFGYLTTNPQYSGSAIMICHELNLSFDIDDSTVATIKVISWLNCSKLVVKKQNKHQLLKLMNVHAHKLKNYIEYINELIKREKKEKMYELIKIPKLTSILNIDLLNSYKTYEVDLTLMDCFNKNYDLIAKAKEAYDLYNEIYLNYLEKNVPIDLPKLIEKDFKDDNDYIDLSLEDLAYATNNIVIKIEIGRNFKNYPFRLFMNEKQKNELKEHIVTTFEKIGIKGAIFQYREVFNLQPTLRLINESERYKIQDNDHVYIPSHRRFAVWINQCDHLRYTVECRLSNFNTIVQEIVKVFKIFNEIGLEFTYHPQFGYLSEMAQNLPGNTKFEIKILDLSQAKKSNILNDNMIKDNWDHYLVKNLENSQFILHSKEIATLSTCIQTAKLIISYLKDDNKNQESVVLRKSLVNTSRKSEKSSSNNEIEPRKSTTNEIPQHIVNLKKSLPELNSQTGELSLRKPLAEQAAESLAKKYGGEANMQSSYLRKSQNGSSNGIRKYSNEYANDIRKSINELANDLKKSGHDVHGEYKKSINDYPFDSKRYSMEFSTEIKKSINEFGLDNNTKKLLINESPMDLKTSLQDSSIDIKKFLNETSLESKKTTNDLKGSTNDLKRSLNDHSESISSKGMIHYTGDELVDIRKSLGEMNPLNDDKTINEMKGKSDV